MHDSKIEQKLKDKKLQRIVFTLMDNNEHKSRRRLLEKQFSERDLFVVDILFLSS